MLVVPLPALEELGCEEVVGTTLLLGDIEDVTLDADIELCEDIEEENPVLGVDEAPPPGLLVVDGVNDTVCVGETVSEVGEDPDELYKEDDVGDTVGTRREVEPVELKAEVIDKVVLDDDPGLLLLVV